MIGFIKILTCSDITINNYFLSTFLDYRGDGWMGDYDDYYYYDYGYDYYDRIMGQNFM